MNGGEFFNSTDDEAYKFLEKLSENSKQWGFSKRKKRLFQTVKK